MKDKPSSVRTLPAGTKSVLATIFPCWFPNGGHHSVRLPSFRPCTCRQWRLMVPTWEKRPLHTGQTMGFSPVWVRMCVFSSAFVRVLRPQKAHTSCGSQVEEPRVGSCAADSLVGQFTCNHSKSALVITAVRFSQRVWAYISYTVHTHIYVLHIIYDYIAAKVYVWQ